MKRAMLSMLSMLSMIVFASALMAQPGPPPEDGPGPRGEALQNALNITAEQAEALRTFVREQRQQTREALQAEGVPERMRTNREALRTALESATPNAEEVGRLMIEGKALRDKVKAAHDATREAIRNYVTTTLGRADELAKLEAAAELMPAVAQARMLGLLEGPEGPRAGRFGLRGMAGNGPMSGGFMGAARGRRPGK